MGQKRHKKRRQERQNAAERTLESGAARQPRRAWMIAGGLVAVAAAALVVKLLAGAGAGPRLPVPETWPRVELGDARLPVRLVRTLAGREQMVPPQLEPARPLTRFFRSYTVAAGVLFAYPEEEYRSVHFDDDCLGGTLGLFFLDARGRIVTFERVGSAGRLVLSPRPSRFTLFVPGDWLDAHPVDPERPVGLPESVFGDAEPEFTRIPDPVTIHVNGVALRVEVAHTSDLRNRGLMYRNYVPEGTGMLFLFPRPARQKFWMRNTRVPLDIAYIDAAHVIRNIVTMRAHDLDLDRKYGSSGPVVMALETPAGWFQAHGIEPGHSVAIGERLEALRRTADP